MVLFEFRASSELDECVDCGTDEEFLAVVRRARQPALWFRVGLDLLITSRPRASLLDTFLWLSVTSRMFSIFWWFIHLLFFSMSDLQRKLQVSLPIYKSMPDHEGVWEYLSFSIFWFRHACIGSYVTIIILTWTTVSGGVWEYPGDLKLHLKTLLF